MLLPTVFDFLKKVRQSGPDECWAWRGAIDQKGYGAVKVGGKKQSAHRVSWKLFRGPIPSGLCVLHHCDNPGCVNPEHLFLGTPRDNARDCVKKGRHNFSVHPECHVRGERAWNAKLTEEDVRAIRREFTLGTNRKDMARRFGIGCKHIWAIANGRLWKHVK